MGSVLLLLHTVTEWEASQPFEAWHWLQTHPHHKMNCLHRRCFHLLIRFQTENQTIPPTSYTANTSSTQLDLLLSTVDCCMHTIYSHTPHSIIVNFYCTLHVCNYPRWLLCTYCNPPSRLTLRHALHLSCACVVVPCYSYYHCCSIAISSDAISF